MDPERKKNTDGRLLKAYESIDAGLVEVLSLDIFDTLLWRMVPSPKDLFLILGKKLKEEGWLIPAITPLSFSELRIKAERVARQEKEIAYNTSEIYLSEIYWKLQSLFNQISIDQMLAENAKGIFESDVSELIKIETSLEKELIQFDPNIIQLMLYAKAKNIPVILISDTYFELMDIHFFVEPYVSCFHKIYPSCEYGCGKRSGLFQKVIQELNVTPQKILHIGDNYKSDISAARSAGVTALYFQKYNDQFEAILEREWTCDLYKRGQLLDSRRGDFGITALRSKIFQHTDLQEIKGENRFFWKYGATILGPILFGFVHWLYDRCFEMKQTQVFCLMREGQLYANLIKHFAPYYPQYAIDAQTLWVSRFFIAHAALSNANTKELTNVMKVLFRIFSLETSCAYLGLDINQMPKWSKYRHVTLEDPSLLKEFVSYVVSQESLNRQIVQSAYEKRQRFLKYFSGLTDFSKNSQITLVDVGWNGTIQGALQHILQLAHSQAQLHGLYLGTTQSVYSPLLQGSVREGYLIKCGHPFGHAHMKGCFVLEQTASAEAGVGSLQDIDGEGKIITSPLLIPEKQKKQAQLIQKGIFAFFDHIGPYVKSGTITWNSHSEELQNQLRSLFLRSMVNTTYVEAEKLGPWLHDHGPTSSLTQVIGKDHYYERFIKDMLPAAAFKESGLNWPSAYAAKHSKYLTYTSQAMWLKTFPHQCLLSEDNFLLSIFLDKGRGFSKKAYEEIELRSNPNRNFFTTFKIFSSKKSIERIQLVLSFPSALVRIMSLRFLIFDKKTANPHQLIFFESDDQTAPIECVADKKIDFNTFYCDEAVKLIHIFDHKDIYQIKVKLCCEMFKMN